jgi:hypothetical protein
LGDFVSEDDLLLFEGFLKYQGLDPATIALYPRGDRDWDAHASYHLDGTFHQKSYGTIWGTPQRRQPLTEAFKGSEHLGTYAGHGTKSIGAVCHPAAFTGVMIVEPGILGPRHGAVAIELAEPGCEGDDLSYGPRLRRRLGRRTRASQPRPR